MDTDWNLVGVVWRWKNVWLLLTLLLLLLTSADGQEYIAEGCPGGKEDSPPVEVTLTCPEGQVISLGEAKFGRNKYTHCTITDGDCLDKTDAFIGCEGRHNCTVYFDRPFSPTCGYATFITVTYDCRAVTTTPPPLVRLSTSTRYVSNTAKVRITSTAAFNNHAGKTNPEEDNTALIAGCVVAVTVTVVLLIIAIVMVVRRLACGADLSEDEEKKSSSCHVLPCVRGDQTGSGPKAPQEGSDSPHSGEGDDAKRSKRKRKHRGRWADKNQNMSPRLAPVGQEDEEDSSASQNRTVAAAAAAGAGVYSEGGGGGTSSARSSLVMDSSGQLKRRSSSSGARSANSDIVVKHREAAAVSELDDFSRRGGEGVGLRRGAQHQGKGARLSTGSGKMSAAGLSAPSQDKGPPVRMHMPASSSSAESQGSRQRGQFDAVAVPNTEAFTSC